MAEYQLRKTYGQLLDMVEQAFEKEKPLFSLALYYPLAYYKGPDIEQQKRAFAENRQREVVGKPSDRPFAPVVELIGGHRADRHQRGTAFGMTYRHAEILEPAAAGDRASRPN